MQSKYIVLNLLFLSVHASFSYSAGACELIEEDNRNLVKELLRQESAVAQFQMGLETMELSCQNASALISRKASATATAEACIAMRENASMNDELTATGEACSSSTDVARNSIQTFTAEFVGPFERSLSELVELDTTLTNLQRMCPAELQRTKEVQARATEVLRVAHLNIERAKIDVQKFTAVAEQTKAFSLSSKDSLARCAVEASESSPTAAPLGKGIGTKEAKLGAPLRNSNSTITGVLEAKLKESLGVAIMLTGGAPASLGAQVSFSPEPMRSSLAKGQAQEVAAAKVLIEQKPNSAPAAQAIPAEIKGTRESSSARFSADVKQATLRKNSANEILESFNGLLAPNTALKSISKLADRQPASIENAQAEGSVSSVAEFLESAQALAAHREKSASPSSLGAASENADKVRFLGEIAEEAVGASANDSLFERIHRRIQRLMSSAGGNRNMMAKAEGLERHAQAQP